MHAHDEDSAPRGALLGPIAITALVLAALWAVDLLFLRTRLLAPLEGKPALVPLYAFWSPLLRPQAIVFVVVAVAFAACASRLADPARTSRRAFVIALAAAALVLPFALFLVRQDPVQLGREFVFYQNDEFYFDARRIIGLGDFLRYYVELMPQLSLHGQHFPPGHATLLYLVSTVFGDGTLPAGLTCLVCFAAAIVFAYLALLRLTGEDAEAGTTDAASRRNVPRASRARQGVLLLLATPALLDFACTSMDAVFLMLATIAWWIGIRAFGPDARRWNAIATGAALLVATCFSFSALPVGLALGLYGIFAGRGHARRTFACLAWIGASYVLSAVLLDVCTGFSISACLAAARNGAHELMDRAAGRTVTAMWPELSFGNALAFALGAGLALVPAAAVGLVSGKRAQDPVHDPAQHRTQYPPVQCPSVQCPSTRAVLLALIVMSCGGIYFLETERIWMFAMPWLAAVAVARRSFEPSGFRLLLALGLAQAWAMEVLLFTLW